MEFHFAQIVAQSDDSAICDGQRLYNAGHAPRLIAERAGARHIAQTAGRLYAMVW